MAKQYPAIDDSLRDFILRQRIFFTASATASGRINLSPRGIDALRVLGPNAVAYLDLTGSGAETAAHLRADPDAGGGRLTLMVCAFEGAPRILRLYGRGRSLVRGSAGYAEILAAQYGNREPLGARQIVTLDVELVQTSCGFGVPLFSYEGERDTLEKWAQAKGEAGLAAYRREKNSVSLDGLPTGLGE